MPVTTIAPQLRTSDLDGSIRSQRKRVRKRLDLQNNDNLEAAIMQL